MKKIALYVAGFGLLGYALYKYFKVQALKLSDYDYKVIGIKIRSITKEQIVFDVTLRFINKSEIEAKIEKVYIDMYVEDTNVGFVTETKEFVIPANGESDVMLTFYVSPQAVFKNAVSILLGAAQKKDANVRIKGYAKIKSGLIGTTIPLEYSTTVKTYLGA